MKRLLKQKVKKMTNIVQSETESFLDFAPLGRLMAKYLGEAPLYFKNGAMDIDPKRGLSIHGPVDSGDDIQTIRVGVVSDSQGIQNVTTCLEVLNKKPVRNSGTQPFTTLTFPGFEKAFNARFIFSKNFNQELLNKEISHIVDIENPNLRIKKAVELYARKVRNICDRVETPDVILCHKIEPIEKTCGTIAFSEKSTLTKDEKEAAERIRKNVETHRILAPLDSDTQDFIDMIVKADFRRMLKAESVKSTIPIQILKQTTIEALNCEFGIPSIAALKHRKEDPSTIAWNLTVALYYKSNHFPWRVGNLVSGTCYVGISFYYDKTSHDKNMFASLAQVFTDTGEGMIVRGDSFNWDMESRSQPHLSRDSAHSLLSKALGLYRSQ